MAARRSSRPSCPVLRFVPGWWGEGGDLSDVLVPESDSLEGWPGAWLGGERVWERVGRTRRCSCPPPHSWFQTRSPNGGGGS